MVRELKFRLIIDNKVVGYERWDTLAEKWCYDTELDGSFDIKNPFISHTDKRQFSNRVDVKGRELYDEEKVKHVYTGKPGTIVFSHIGNDQGWTGFWITYEWTTSHWPFKSEDIEIIDE